MRILREFIDLAKSIQRSLSRWLSAGKLAIAAGLVSICLVSLSAPAQAADIDYSKTSEGAIQSTERYDNIQSQKGGMNGFDAADPRRNIGEAKAKAQELSDVAKRRQLQADDPLEPVREAVDSIKDQIGSTADTATDKAARTVDSVTDKAARRADSVTDKTARGVESVTDKANRAVDSVAEDLR